MKYDELKEKLSNFPAVMVDKTIVIEMIAEIARLRSLIERLKEDAERLEEAVYREYCCMDWLESPVGKAIHETDCPITLHRQMMAEIEREE